MEFNIIQSLPSQLLTGATLESLKVAGAELEIFFTGLAKEGPARASLNTDAWVFVSAEAHAPTELPNDDHFFQSRSSAIIGLYELTGYTVEEAGATHSGALWLRLGGRYVHVVPEALASPSLGADSWHLIIEVTLGLRQRYLAYYQGQGYSTGAF